MWFYNFLFHLVIFVFPLCLKSNLIFKKFIHTPVMEKSFFSFLWGLSNLRLERAFFVKHIFFMINPIFLFMIPFLRVFIEAIEYSRGHRLDFIIWHPLSEWLSISLCLRSWVYRCLYILIIRDIELLFRWLWWLEFANWFRIYGVHLYFRIKLILQFFHNFHVHRSLERDVLDRPWVLFVFLCVLCVNSIVTIPSLLLMFFLNG